MGSYDKMPEGWDEFGDAGWAPRHVIFCRSGWSGAPEGKHEHENAALVRLCYEAARDEQAGVQVWPCGWGMQELGEDGYYTVLCPLPARYTGAGRYECAGGHSHVEAEQRLAEGWDYATEDEAAGLMRAGTRPVGMDGKALF